MTTYTSTGGLLPGLIPMKGWLADNDILNEKFNTKNVTFEQVEKYRQEFYAAYVARQKRILKFIAICVTLFLLPVFSALLAVFLITQGVSEESDIIVVLSGAVPFLNMAAVIVGFFFLFRAIFRGQNSRSTVLRAHAHYVKAYKAYFVGNSLKQVFVNYVYDHKSGIPQSELGLTELINTGDLYYTNDRVSGKYHNLDFTQADVKIVEEYRDSDGDTSYATLFQGRWMKFRLAKQFSGHVVVAGKYFGGALKNDRRGVGALHKVTLESQEFNHLFNVYAESETEARYLLDPAFMERVVALSKRYRDSILLMVANNELHIAINDHKDSFEPPRDYKEPLNVKNELSKALLEIRMVTDVVDALKLK